MPKSVTKVTKNKQGQVIVKYIDNVDRVNYTIQELTKAALRDVGKVLTKHVASNTPKRTGNLSKAFSSWNTKDDKGMNVLKIGTYYSKKRAEKSRKAYAPYLHLVVFPKTNRDGSMSQGNNFFYDTVFAHLDIVRETEAKYLSAIDDELEATRLCEESEKMSDEN